jgi:protein-disulfide isomerase
MIDDRMQTTEITNADWIRGKLDAPVTILEYGDFECPYCGAAHPVLKALGNDFPEQIRLVYRHFPITSAHPHAFMAAEAAEAAGKQGAFWEMHDLLFTHQRQLEYEYLRSYAEQLNLDIARFDREMKANTYAGEVRSDFRQGVEDGVNGTPTLFINRLRYDGPREYGSMLAAIKAIAPVQQR